MKYAMISCACVALQSILAFSADRQITCSWKLELHLVSKRKYASLNNNRKEWQ